MAEIVYYARPNGVCPFSDWFDSLNADAAVKVATAIERITDGNLGDAKSVGDGVWERRINYGPGYRIYFGREGSEWILLLCGGTKKRQQADIQRAKLYWAEYKRRKEKD